MSKDLIDGTGSESGDRGGATQPFLLGSMALVALAAGAALHLHGGLPLPLAAGVSLAAFIVAYVAHRMVLKRALGASAPAAPKRLKEAPRQRPRGPGPVPTGRLDEARMPPPPPPAPGAGAASALPPKLPGQRPLHPGPMFPETRAAAELARPPLRASAPPLPGTAPGQPPLGAAPPAAMPPPVATPPALGSDGLSERPLSRLQAARAAATKPAAPAAAASAPPPAETMQDYWSFRPAQPTLDLPPFVAGRVKQVPAGERAGSAGTADGRPAPVVIARSERSGEATGARSAPPPAAPTLGRDNAKAADRAPAATPPPAPPTAAAPKDTDVEIIQDAIKRLLEQVNAAEATPPARAPEVPAAAAPPPTPPPAPTPTAAIDSSLEALRMTADAMRTPAKAPPLPGAQRVPTPPAVPSLPAAEALPAAKAWTPPLSAPHHAKGVAITDAIAAGRIDVLLDPILGLEDQRARHYEVSIRLRDTAGEIIGTNGDELRGTGLLPLFDCARVSRTAAMARRLEERGKVGAVFSSFNGESLSDERFLGDLADTLGERAAFAGQLVLAFTQAEVAGFGGAEWETLGDMRALGFRFAIAEVTHLDMDFLALAEQGFLFAKLDADVFLRGLPAGAGLIPADDVCRHLAKAGLTLVVEKIDDEEKLARIFGFGALLGQGHLFGGPRPVRTTAVGATTAAA